MTDALLSADYCISLHLFTGNAPAVVQALVETFKAHGWAFTQDIAAAVAVDDDDNLPDGDWYGVVISSKSGTGWTTVYVEDWQDTGLLAAELSRALNVPALEVWIAEGTHWGYTFWQNGIVQDRFADAVEDGTADAALYDGSADALAPVLAVPPHTLQAALTAARAQAGQFAGPGVDALAGAVGLPFEHVFTGYDFFFADDPQDYGPSLEQWTLFRHLAFRHPAGRETLAD